MADRRGITGRLIGAYEDRTGGRVLRADEADELSEALQDARVRERDFERLRYDVLNAQPDSPDLSHQDRLKFVKEAREIWQRDALLGAAVDLMNDFTFGSGVPRPRAKDAEVQKVLDEAWCHDEQTEVLTEDGWLGMEDVQARWSSGVMPRVAVWRDGLIDYEAPRALNVTSVDGPMVRFRTRQVDMLVTPNHRMLVRGGRKVDEVQVKRADEVGPAWKVPASARSVAGVRVEKFVLPGCSERARRHADVAAGVTRTDDGKRARRAPVEVEMDAFLRWLGWWLAEGHVSYGGAKPSWVVNVVQATSSRLLPEVQAACSAFPGSERTVPTHWGGKWEWKAARAKQLGLWLMENAQRGGLKRVPEFVFALCAEQQEVVLRGLLMGDGNFARISQRGSGGFYTSSPWLADDVQRLAINCGWQATARCSEGRRGHSDEYVVNLNRRRERWLPDGIAEQYQGRVWCFSMPSGTMVTRRNGAVAFSGNTDADNQLVLTSHSAQMALGTDLSLQSNIFPLAFDDGDDGKVKLGLLNHDTVRDVVRDPDNRLRIMYYVAREEAYEWDFAEDKRKPVDTAGATGAKKVAYYAHFRNVEDKREAGESFDEPGKDKRGEGVVYHIAINRTSEMAFGVPVMRRVIRWAGALNEFMAARVDLTKATAAFIMKRTIKGGPTAVAQQGAKQLSRRAPIGSASLDPHLGEPPRPGSVLNENEQVTHSALNLSSNAANAQQDAAMLRAPLSAALRFPPHYFGDTQNASLATACHDDQTETLTEDGWMGLAELKQRAAAGRLPRVASYDVERGVAEFHAPLGGLALYPYSGPMARFKNRYFDMLVTPNHRMLVRRGDSIATAREPVFVEARHLGKRRAYSAVSARLAGGVRVKEFTLPAYAVLMGNGRGLGTKVMTTREPVTLPMDAWLAWLGWYIAEGCGQAIVCQQEDSPWLDELRAACLALGVEGKERWKTGRGGEGKRMWFWQPKNPRQFASWLDEFCGVGASAKRVPEFVFALPADQQKLVLRGLMGGDGWAPDGWETQGYSAYGTTSPGLADDVQRLAFACGFTTSKKLESSYATKRGPREAWKVNMRIGGVGGYGSASRADQAVLPRPVREGYCGEVYCFTLPHGTLVTRRGGVIAIQGNTAAELPVLKAIASRQELFEQLFRWFNDRVITKAVEAGRIDERKSTTELEEARHARAALLVRGIRPADEERPEAYVKRVMDIYEAEVLALREAETEEDSKRDLTYEFSMPNPLKRMMGELIGAVGDIAKTFDPNGTNIELTRALLAIALGEGLEVHDPAALVKRAFPEGYQDPALAALAAQQGGGGMPDNFVATDGPDGTTPPGERSTTGADGKQRTEDNAYGAPARAQDAEDVQEAAVEREDVLAEEWAREVSVAAEEALAEIDRAYSRNGMG